MHLIGFRLAEIKPYTINALIFCIIYKKIEKKSYWKRLLTIVSIIQQQQQTTMKSKICFLIYISLLFCLIDAQPSSPIPLCRRPKNTWECSFIQTQDECVQSFMINRSNWQTRGCAWVSGTCSLGNEVCKPPCFLEWGNELDSCIPEYSCGFNNNFATGSGVPKLCPTECTVPGYPCGCGQELDCDESCTGYEETTSCGHHTPAACSRYYTKQNGIIRGCRHGYNNYNYSCHASYPCKRLCRGTQNVTSSSCPNVSVCGTGFKKIGNEYHNCKLTASNTCSVDMTEACTPSVPKICSGTQSTTGCVGLNKTQCSIRFELNSNGKSQCEWVYGNGACGSGYPCQ